MNQKYLIALFVFFFFIHVEKTYACHPSAEFHCDDWINDRVLIFNLLLFTAFWANKEIIIFIYSMQQ
jgi:hypothetical protein